MTLNRGNDPTLIFWVYEIEILKRSPIDRQSDRQSTIACVSTMSVYLIREAHDHYRPTIHYMGVDIVGRVLFNHNLNEST